MNKARNKRKVPRRGQRRRGEERRRRGGDDTEERIQRRIQRRGGCSEQKNDLQLPRPIFISLLSSFWCLSFCFSPFLPKLQAI